MAGELRIAFLSLLASSAALLAQSPPDALPGTAPALDAATFAAYWAHVVPSAEELEWRRIPWLGTLAEGVVAAQTADKPILLWAMNGHPLACT